MQSKPSRADLREVVRDVLAEERDADQPAAVADEADDFYVDGSAPAPATMRQGTKVALVMLAVIGMLGMIGVVAGLASSSSSSTGARDLGALPEMQTFQRELAALDACKLTYQPVGSALFHEDCSGHDTSHLIMPFVNLSAHHAYVQLIRNSVDEPWQITATPRDTSPAEVVSLLTAITPIFVKELAPGNTAL